MVGHCLRLRYLPVIKSMLLFGLGFTVRSLIDLSTACLPSTSDCPPCVNWDQVAEQELLKQDIHQQLREPYKPKTMYEVIRYDYFNMSAILNNFDDDPKTGLLGHQKSDVMDILHQAVTLFNSGRHKQWKLKKLLNGYRRFDPLRGEEFVLDLMLVQPMKPGEEEGDVTEVNRLELVKPFGTVQLVSQRNVDNIRQDKMIHFILPVTSTNTKLERFLRNFEEVVLRGENSDVYLLIVLFVETGPKSKDAKVTSIKDMALSLSRKYRHAHVSVVQTRKPFSRALGLDLGVRQVPGNALLFFCDVDVQISRGFTSRCRQNAVFQRQVYYPIVFAQYDPKLVERFSTKEKYHDLYSINKYTGHWVHYGFGMACLYAADYRSVGGLDLDTKGWGGEDVDLYRKHVTSDLRVFRAADPGLLHVYHDKFCDPSLPPDQLRMCVDSQAEGRGSKQQLSKLLSVTQTREIL